MYGTSMNQSIGEIRSDIMCLGKAESLCMNEHYSFINFSLFVIEIRQPFQHQDDFRQKKKFFWKLYSYFKFSQKLFLC